MASKRSKTQERIRALLKEAVSGESSDSAWEGDQKTVGESKDKLGEVP